MNGDFSQNGYQNLNESIRIQGKAVKMFCEQCVVEIALKSFVKTWNTFECIKFAQSGRITRANKAIFCAESDFHDCAMDVKPRVIYDMISTIGELEETCWKELLH